MIFEKFSEMWPPSLIFPNLDKNEIVIKSKKPLDIIKAVVKKIGPILVKGGGLKLAGSGDNFINEVAFKLMKKFAKWIWKNTEKTHRKKMTGSGLSLAGGSLKLAGQGEQDGGFIFTLSAIIAAISAAAASASAAAASIETV